MGCKGEEGLKESEGDGKRKVEGDEREWGEKDKKMMERGE